MNATVSIDRTGDLSRQKADAFLRKPMCNLIDGAWLDAVSGETLESQDPATERILARIPSSGAGDVDLAVAAARRAFEAGPWPGLSASARGALLWRLADLLEANIAELAAIETYDNGAPFWMTTLMVQFGVSSLRYYAGMASKIHGRTSEISSAAAQYHAYTRAEPVGVVGLITPWNGPIGVLCNKVAPAAAAGCTCVIKPAELTSLTAIRFGELVNEAGIPPGVINIVCGLGLKAGQALADHQDVDKISFTGSTATGRKLIVAAAGNFKRLTLELGGKSPLIILDDADLEAAIPAAAAAIFMNSGQVCYAGSRLYIHSKVYDRVVAGIADFGAKMRLGNGFEPGTQLGPLVSRGQRDRVLGYIRSGIADGVELVSGGKAVDSLGYFVQPTVFSNAKSETTILQEEIFGPVLVANRFDDLEGVLKQANATRYGLGAGVFTSDISAAHRIAKSLRAGNVWINCYGIMDQSMPFGGFKESGWGRELGFDGIQAFLEQKAIYAQL